MWITLFEYCVCVCVSSIYGTKDRKKEASEFDGKTFNKKGSKKESQTGKNFHKSNCRIKTFRIHSIKKPPALREHNGKKLNQMQDKKILPNIYIDNVILDLPNSHIYVSCLINNEEKDFDLNQEKFEIFIDDNELKPYECFGFEWTDNQMPWNAIYQNKDALYKLIEQYIEDLYIQEAFDIQTTLKNF